MSKVSFWVFGTYPPFVGQSKNLGSHAIAKIFEKRSLLARMKRDQKKYDVKLDGVLETGSATNITAVQVDLERAEKRINDLEVAILHQETHLGLTGGDTLKHFKNSEFLQLRVNATILQDRIVACLVEHRFEMSKFDRLACYECMGKCIDYVFHCL